MRFFLAWIALGLLAAVAVASDDAVLDGARLALHSSGSSANSSWTLTSNGYVGAYIRLDATGDVTFTLNASGTHKPQMNLVVDDQSSGWEVGDEAADYAKTLTLPPGMHVVRIELNNYAVGRALTVNHVAISGAALVNEHTDANALTAADSYIANCRQGPATVTLKGVPEGTQVHVKLKRHAFNFGTVIPGFHEDGLLAENPPPGSDAQHYQQFILDHFNTIVPGNAGKWDSTEAKQGQPTMEYVDRIRQFAKANGLRMRMHNLLWGNQQPGWVNPLLKSAAAGDENAKKQLREAVSRRIGYYVRDRAADYSEMDVLNEARLNPPYWKAFGAPGIADIYNETAKAVAEAGAHTLLYTNEYNVFQWSFSPDMDGHGVKPDPYANWYRENIEEIKKAGGGVTGIGVQYYADISKGAQKDGPHSAARMLQAMQNLSVTGLPICLTEFGVQRGSDKTGDPDLAAQAIGDAVRISFGTARVNGFLVWGFRMPWLWEKADVGALLDKEWNPTPAGKRFLELMESWNTDLNATVGADGTIRFTGFYGDYELTVGERKGGFSLVKGTAQYTVDLRTH